MPSKNGSAGSFQYQLQIRKNDLEKAKQQLKTEFFGLDQVIDQVIDQVSSWYCFPDFREHPLVVNLWGMTGTGKSSLVNRLSALLGYNKSHYRFDMGEIGNSFKKMNIYDQLTDTAYREAEEQFIISLDEFQHARSLDANGQEAIKPEERVIWQLLDSGTIEVDNASTKSLQKLQFLCDILKAAIQAHIPTGEGRIKDNQHDWLKILETHIEGANAIFVGPEKDKLYKEAEANPTLVPRFFYETITLAGLRGLDTVMGVEEHLKSLDAKQTLDLIITAKQSLMQPQAIDCSGALIVVIGNLDEAYPMHQHHHPDMDADHFHRLASDIDITGIKAALQKRFRSEEIARLGNNHIIYPALRKQDFQAIIQQEMGRVKTRLEKKIGIAVTMEAALENLLFEEGVYPAQGTRPVFTTIHQLIYPLVMDALLAPAADLEFIAEIALTYEYPDLKARIYWLDGSDKQTEIVSRRQQFSLTYSRASQGDDFQAIRAVHEAGHAIGSTFLEGLIPELICSKTADSSNSGFTLVHRTQQVRSKRYVRNQIAAMLGGYAAELQVFGEEQLTSGSGKDLEEATNLLTTLFREKGMGAFPAYFRRAGPGLNNSVKDHGEIDREVRSWIEACLQRIQATLENQTNLLMQMAAYLSDHPRMEKEQIRAYCRHFGTGFDEAQLRKDAGFGYRTHLQALIKENEKALDEAKA